MKNYILPFVCLLVGIGAGIGIWYGVTSPKLEQQQTQIDNLQTELDDASVKSDEVAKKASNEIAQLRKELTMEKSKQRALNKMVIQARTELQALKRKSATQPQTEPTQPKQKTSASASTTTREYIVKDGDSCWKIAADELGDGSRYTEIIELNGLSKNPKLNIGMKLKLPAR